MKAGAIMEVFNVILNYQPTLLIYKLHTEYCQQDNFVKNKVGAQYFEPYFIFYLVKKSQRFFGAVNISLIDFM